VLVPLGPPLLTYKSNCKAMLTADGDSVQLVVDQPYKAGEPLIIWYYVCFYCISILVLPHRVWPSWILTQKAYFVQFLGVHMKEYQIV
jgi:hypothetical protein